MGEIWHEWREADLGDKGEIHAKYAVDMGETDMGEIWHERREADLACAAATLPGDHLYKYIRLGLGIGLRWGLGARVRVSVRFRLR